MPKKPPPSLPLSIFSPITPPCYQSSRSSIKRTTPILVIDAHVFIVIENQDEAATAVRSWQQTVRALTDRLAEQPSPVLETDPGIPTGTFGFLGFIHVHRQPSWSFKSCQSSCLNGQPSSVEYPSINQAVERVWALDDIHPKFDICPPLAQVIWAPLNQGPKALSLFLDRLDNTKRPVVGCCHLIEQPSTGRNASLTNSDFVASLQLLGERGLAVEFHVDNNRDRSAPIILEEILECVSLVRHGQTPEKETKFVICQMGKPETISSQSVVPSSASYSSILSRLFSLSLFSNLNIKLSSLPLLVEEDLVKQACDYFSRFKQPYQSIGLADLTLEASNESEETFDRDSDGVTNAQGEFAWREIKKRIKFYLEPILEAFGDHRIMYSSNYPCFCESHLSIDSKGAARLYGYQFEIYRECLTELGLENESLDNIFGLNARGWYKV